MLPAGVARPGRRRQRVAALAVRRRGGPRPRRSLAGAAGCRSHHGPRLGRRGVGAASRVWVAWGCASCGRPRTAGAPVFAGAGVFVLFGSGVLVLFGSGVLVCSGSRCCGAPWCCWATAVCEALVRRRSAACRAPRLAVGPADGRLERGDPAPRWRCVAPVVRSVIEARSSRSPARSLRRPRGRRGRSGPGCRPACGSWSRPGRRAGQAVWCVAARARPRRSPCTARAGHPSRQRRPH